MSTLLKNGWIVDDPRLDRVPSETTEHREKYPLTSSTMPSDEASMVAGTNWYSGMDNPVQVKIQGRTYWVIGQGDLGHVRGGHATCLRNYGLKDLLAWWIYYDQLKEGRCVEFAKLRMLSQMNRKRYDITSRWHYWEAQKTDEWQGGSYPGASPHYEGTSVRAGLEVLRAHGAIVGRRGGAAVPIEQAPSLVKPSEGISTYRWAQNWDDVRRVLRVPGWMPGVPLNNSWGKGYPKEVILLDEAGARLLAEDGEFGAITDR